MMNTRDIMKMCLDFHYDELKKWMNYCDIKRTTIIMCAIAYDYVERGLY